jgi:hypothetical protein
MPAGIGAAGILGLAFEVTPGTYVAPTKFAPIRSESLAWKQDTIWRRAIAGTSDPLGAVAGNGSFDGDITMEALPDAVQYFLYAGRTSVAKTGAGPYTYTTSPTSNAQTTAGRTLSLTIVRNGVTYGYTNCSVVKHSWTVDNGLLVVTFSIIGSDEATQTLPTATYSTQAPFGAGMYDLEIPTGTPVFDSDAFTFEVDDSGQQNYRLRNTGRGPAFASFGDRSTSMSMTRDFISRTEYDAFKALTSKSISFKAVNGADEIDFVMPASIADTYEVALTGTGDLIRATTKYMGVKASPAAYQVVVKTTENIT